MTLRAILNAARLASANDQGRKPLEHYLQAELDRRGLVIAAKPAPYVRPIWRL